MYISEDGDIFLKPDTKLPYPCDENEYQTITGPTFKEDAWTRFT